MTLIRLFKLLEWKINIYAKLITADNSGFHILMQKNAPMHVVIVIYSHD